MRARTPITAAVLAATLGLTACAGADADAGDALPLADDAPVTTDIELAPDDSDAPGEPMTQEVFDGLMASLGSDSLRFESTTSIEGVLDLSGTLEVDGANDPAADALLLELDLSGMESLGDPATEGQLALLFREPVSIVMIGDETWAELGGLATLFGLPDGQWLYLQGDDAGALSSGFSPVEMGVLQEGATEIEHLRWEEIGPVDLDGESLVEYRIHLDLASAGAAATSPGFYEDFAAAIGSDRLTFRVFFDADGELRRALADEAGPDGHYRLDIRFDGHGEDQGIVPPEGDTVGLDELFGVGMTDILE